MGARHKLMLSEVLACIFSYPNNVGNLSHHHQNITLYLHALKATFLLNSCQVLNKREKQKWNQHLLSLPRVHSLRGIYTAWGMSRKIASLVVSHLLWLQVKERLQSWHDHKVPKNTKPEVVQKTTAYSLIALEETCIPPAAFQADACIDLCKLPPSERLHSSPGHIFRMSSSLLEITTLLRSGHPVFTLFYFQTPPEFTFSVCAENLVTAASISPSHSSFQTGKPPEPLFFLNYSHQQEKQRDGNGYWARGQFWWGLG